jgi:hypothetical protein
MRGYIVPEEYVERIKSIYNAVYLRIYGQTDDAKLASATADGVVRAEIDRMRRMETDYL